MFRNEFTVERRHREGLVEGWFMSKRWGILLCNELFYTGLDTHSISRFPTSLTYTAENFTPKETRPLSCEKRVGTWWPSIVSRIVLLVTPSCHMFTTSILINPIGVSENWFDLMKTLITPYDHCCHSHVFKDPDSVCLTFILVGLLLLVTTNSRMTNG